MCEPGREAAHARTAFGASSAGAEVAGRGGGRARAAFGASDQKNKDPGAEQPLSLRSASSGVPPNGRRVRPPSGFDVSRPPRSLRVQLPPVLNAGAATPYRTFVQGRTGWF